MNSVFNKHGRWLFGIITIIIIVSFVGFLTPGFTSLFSGRGAGASYGKAFGKTISRDDMYEQVRLGCVALSLQTGFPPSASFVSQMAESRAFETICMVRAGDNQGIKVGTQELADFMKRMPVFAAKEGAGFDKSKLEAYIKNQLVPAGFSSQDLDNAARQSLVIQKLINQVTENVIVTDDEVREFFKAVHEKFDVSLISLLAADFKKDIRIEEKDLKNFYEANKDSYLTAPKTRADLVSFSYQNFVKSAAKSIIPEDIKLYYDQNIAEFTEGKDKDKKTIPFDKAMPGIKVKLINEKSKTLAMESAQKFAEKVYEALENASSENNVAAVSIFQDEAKKNNFGTVDTDWFEISADSIKGIGKDSQLVNNISQLQERMPVSDPIQGAKAAYVALLKGKQPAAKAEYNTVKSKIAKQLIEIKAAQLAREKARELRSTLDKSADAQKEISQLSKKLKIEKLDTFIPLYKERVQIQNGPAAAELAMNTAQGKVSSVKDVPEGAIFVFVAKREIPSLDEFEKQKAFVELIYKQEKQKAALEAFEAWVNSQCSAPQRGQN
ncbi:MAG: hypothetical protein A2020_12875 [Lentisphaerae bacterium GWF2_45_14]|nr:MAG: hypothetical protein A2020_12875 [Lentisphaerae bacterium GWF2_45_14]